MYIFVPIICSDGKKTLVKCLKIVSGFVKIIIIRPDQSNYQIDEWKLW